MLDESVKADVAPLVRAGFFARDRVVEIVCEELYEPGEVDPDQVDAAVTAAIARLETEKATWPEASARAGSMDPGDCRGCRASSISAARVVLRRR